MRNKSEEEKSRNGPSTLMEGIGPGRLYENMKQARINGIFVGDDRAAVEMCHYILRHGKASQFVP